MFDLATFSLEGLKREMREGHSEVRHNCVRTANKANIVHSEIQQVEGKLKHLDKLLSNLSHFSQQISHLTSEIKQISSNFSQTTQIVDKIASDLHDLKGLSQTCKKRGEVLRSSNEELEACRREEMKRRELEEFRYHQRQAELEDAFRRDLTDFETRGRFCCELEREGDMGDVVYEDEEMRTRLEEFLYDDRGD